MDATDPSSYERAVLLLGVDRPAGLLALERCFAAGQATDDLDGPVRGRLLATTLGHRLDGPVGMVARRWEPWRGKRLDLERAEGRNLLSGSGCRLARIAFPRLPHRPENGTGCSTFGFRTSVAPGVLQPQLRVLRIDYAPAGNPWPVSRVVDEVTTVGDGLYLGQALLRLRGRVRRAAWFSLHR